jgi:hypothetical protein
MLHGGTCALDDKYFKCVIRPEEQTLSYAFFAPWQSELALSVRAYLNDLILVDVFTLVILIQINWLHFQSK